MKKKLCFLLFGISIMLGCSHTYRFYPVQGPLSAQTPTPVLVAKFTGVISSGGISVVLSDGEVCKGHWAEVPQARVGKSPSMTNSPAASDLSSVWDTVYGTGFYVSQVLGAKNARAVATGNRGTVLNVEIYAEPRGKDAFILKGVAKDNKDNIYKVVG